MEKFLENKNYRKKFEEKNRKMKEKLQDEISENSKNCGENSVKLERNIFENFQKTAGKFKKREFFSKFKENYNFNENGQKITKFPNEC